MARTMSVEEYQELGRQYYKQQQYKKAVEAFTEGIEAAARPSVGQLDQRAASYDKLNDLNAALKDGRDMIRIDKKDAKGYLRTGSILQKLNKLDKALDIYKYGMKNVPVDNKDFKVLQQLHDQLTRKLSPAKAIDPLTILPVELAEMVLSHLSFKNIVNCLRVSKAWKTYLTQCPNLWMDLDLSGARRDVSRRFVRNAVSYSQFKLKRMVVHRFRHPDMLVNLATACKGLMDIEFLSGGLLSKTIIDIAKRSSNLRRLVAHVEVTEDAAHQVLSSCASLEHLEFGVIPKFEWRPDIPVLPNLHILSLKSEARADRWLELSTDTIARHLPALEKLTLSGYRTFREDLSLVPLRILTTDCLFQKYPSTLRQLTHKVAPPFSIVGAHWNLIPHYFPYLTHLHLEKYDHSALILYYQLFEDILDSRVDAVPVGINGNASTPAPVLTKISDYTDIANLRHLSLRHCTFSHEHTHEWDETPMAVLLSTSPRVLTNQLEHLDVTGTPCTDADIEKIIEDYMLKEQKLCSLHTINLSKTGVTGAGVKLLVDNLPKLRSLTLDYCERISSRDIVDYAERKGIEVSMKMVSANIGSAGGKKVRYG